ncbi:hypothetical protein JZ751_019421, partial [Albula glossodonta]
RQCHAPPSRLHIRSDPLRSSQIHLKPRMRHAVEQRTWFLFPGSRMNSLEEVPFKIPAWPLEETELVSAPELTLPDYLNLLQETEYEFSLENWVLTGLQGGYPSTPRDPIPHSGLWPTCPPYWQMLDSPPERRLFRPRSHSLSASPLHPWPHSEDEEEVSSPDEESPRITMVTTHCPAHLRKTAPSCLQEFRQSSLSALDPPKGGRGPLCQGQRHAKRRLHPLCGGNRNHSLLSQPLQTRPSTTPA